MKIQWSTVVVVGIVVVGEIVMGALKFEGAQVAALGTVGALATGIMRSMFEARRDVRRGS